MLFHRVKAAYAQSWIPNNLTHSHVRYQQWSGKAGTRTGKTGSIPTRPNRKCVFECDGRDSKGSSEGARRPWPAAR